TTCLLDPLHYHMIYLCPELLKDTFNKCAYAEVRLKRQATNFAKVIEIMFTIEIDVKIEIIEEADIITFKGEIISQQYNIYRDDAEVAYLKTLTKEDTIKFYKKMLAVGTPKYLYMLLTGKWILSYGCRVLIQKCRNLSPIQQSVIILNLTEIKHGLETIYPSWLQNCKD
ncbi:Insulin-degrading enzyme, partial [Galemys pyrenaicus]